MKAIFNGTVVAESSDIVTLEGEHYFPRASLNEQHVTFSNHRSSDARGQAHYLSLFVNGEMKPDAVWFYPEPNEGAHALKDRVAFVAGVAIVD